VFVLSKLGIKDLDPVPRKTQHQPGHSDTSKSSVFRESRQLWLLLTHTGLRLVSLDPVLLQTLGLDLRLGPNPHVYLLLLSTVSPASIRSTEYNQFSVRSGQ
jgi:hypothetical protein